MMDLPIVCETRPDTIPKAGGYLKVPKTKINAYRKAHINDNDKIKIGIAYEDEANFISYVACSKHTDPFVRYSGNFEALLYVFGALKRDENYAHLMSNLNSDTKEEIKKYYEFWQQYMGNLSKVSQKVNDTYLKANSQDDGIKSYSRVVKLLVLYHNINPQ